VVVSSLIPRAATLVTGVGGQVGVCVCMCSERERERERERESGERRIVGRLHCWIFLVPVHIEEKTCPTARDAGRRHVMEDERATANELMKSAEQRPSSMGESAALSIAASRGHTTQFEQARPGGKQMEDVQREERDAEMSQIRQQKEMLHNFPRLLFAAHCFQLCMGELGTAS